MRKINELEEILGVKFYDINILNTALTHSSYAYENNCEHNERLEFLGDAVLELCMSKFLYNKYSLNEGDMTKKRAQSVREEALVIYANHIDLASFIRLGNGEEQTDGREKPAIIADAFEAMLGACFLEFGFDRTYEIFSNIVVSHIEEVLNIKDYKSIFQELVQADKRSVKYEIVGRTGPSHNSVFEAVVLMDDIIMGRGKGKTKRDAEQQAARMALTKAAKM